MQIRLVPVMPLLLATLISCTGGNNEKAGNKARPPVPVEIMIAAFSEFSSDVEVNGTVLPEEQVELHPEVSGRITYLNIPDGEMVKEGTILARINDADLQAQLRQQRVRYELALKTELRLRQLMAVNGVEQATYDAALSEVNLLEASMEVLRAQIDKTVIKAPFSGRLGLRLVSEGAFVTQATVIGTLQQTDRTKIDFSVPETYAGLLKKGRKISVSANHSGEMVPATISAIEPQINPSTRNIRVRARLMEGLLSPGAFVKVFLNEKVTGILVPTSAIIPDAMANQVVLVRGGKAMFQNVETGIRKSDAVEITRGIQAGDSVVVSGVLYVRPNGDVEVTKVKN